MKVKSMKKALSLLCAGAMIATSFAVVNFDTVKAAAYVWNPNTSQSGYPKIPVANLQARADSELAETSEGSSTGGAFPRTGRVANIVDGVVTSFYHSDYEGNEPKVQFSNGTLTGNNTITITFKDNTAQVVKGITYLPRQDALANGAFSQFSVAVQKGTSAEFENVTVNGQNDVTLTYTEANWNNNNTTRAEREVLFDTVQEGVTAIKITVKHSAAYTGGDPNKFLSGAEISVLTSYIDEYDVSNYITAEGVRTAPTRLGKLFAGWYTDATYSTPYLKTTGRAYAKFVDAKVLEAKAQTIATTGLNTPTTTLRFVSTVDSLEYDTVGFDVTANNKTISKSASNVYSQLLSVDGKGGVSVDRPTGFSEESKYFFALNINGIKTANFDSNWTAVPFWITKDGTKVCGKAVNASVYSELRDFYLGTITYNTNNSGKTGIAKADNWTRFDQIDRGNGGFAHNLVSSIPQLNNFKLSGNKNWVIWNENFNTVLFSKKLETENSACAADNYALEYTFNGTGIVVFCSGLAESRTFDVQVDTGEVKTVQLAQLRDKHGNFGIMAYYVTGLTPGEHTLKVSNVTGKVTFEGFYTIPAANK